MSHRYYLPPRSRMPEFAGNCAGLLCIDTIYTIGSMPHYTQYWNYWATIAASLALCIICHVLMQHRPELVLLPSAALAIIACASLSLVHWMEIILFFLLLLIMLLRLPPRARPFFQAAGILTAGIGVAGTLVPMFQRIAMLSAQGSATAKFVVPYVLRTLGGDVMCLLSLLFLLLAFQPRTLPGWMDEDDQYDRIWE